MGVLFHEFISLKSVRQKFPIISGGVLILAQASHYPRSQLAN